jgi:hypothetical protein
MHKILTLSALACACVSVNALPILDVEYQQTGYLFHLWADVVGLDADTRIFIDGTRIEPGRYGIEKLTFNPAHAEMFVELNVIGWDVGEHSITTTYQSADETLAGPSGLFTVSPYTVPPRELPESVPVLPLAAFGFACLAIARKRFS